VKRLVVAQWNEDVAWVDRARDWAVRVVRKGVDLPNRGREPSSFLYAIVADYSHIEPGDIYCFVQGDPYVHCADLDARLTNPIAGGFRWLGGDRRLGPDPLTSDGMGRPHDSGCPVAETYEQWTGRPFPGVVSFHPGGQFMVDGGLIRRYSLPHYLRAYSELLVDGGRLPYAYERLWGAFFDRAAP
jgi:hypothetical protein